MAQTTDNLQQPKSALEVLLEKHLDALGVKGYSEYTVRNRLVHIRFFLRWCTAAGISNAAQITPDVLESYQRSLFDCRKRNGQPLAMVSRHSLLVPLRVWFRWMARQNHIAANPAAELELPRIGRSLPRNVLSVREVERVLLQPDRRTRLGLRDRAILEVLYSTGIRRLELVRLTLSDLHLDRGLIFVRQGKGKKDRYVPIGQRAVMWLQKYVRRARRRLVCNSDVDTVFVSALGRPLSRDHLTSIARKYIQSAKLGKAGACHLFRHTMATLMHDNGADIHCIQRMLGHADIRTTQIYTQVAIRRIQQVHAATHPAER